VFVRLWTTKSVYRPDLSRFSTWLLTISRRIYLDKVKHSTGRSTLSMNGAVEALIDGSFNHSEHSAARHWFREDVQIALETLRREERFVIELAYFHGLTLTEIASRLNRPIGTVKTRLHKGLKALRVRMSDWKGGLG
jgi:RNA polymerase sigma-70 factor (ECF subfamily)